MWCFSALKLHTNSCLSPHLFLEFERNYQQVYTVNCIKESSVMSPCIFPLLWCRLIRVYIVIILPNPNSTTSFFLCVLNIDCMSANLITSSQIRPSLCFVCCLLIEESTAGGKRLMKSLLTRVMFGLSTSDQIRSELLQTDCLLNLPEHL